MIVCAIQWSQIASNIACSVIASFIFLYIILYLLRPSIKISPFISKEKDKDTNEYKYVFKILNKSWFSAYDVRTELMGLEKYPAEEDNMNVKITPLELKYGKLEHLPRYRNTKKSKPFALHATRFKTFDTKVESILDDPKKSLQFSVTARHGLSGLSKHFKQEFADVDILKSTPFRFGNSLDVK